MRVTIFGSGYVGLVTGACMAETGNHVVCVDIDEDKIARLNRGEIPIYEPGLDALVKNNLASARLRFTTDIVASVRASDIIFIAVGTPPDEDGSADLQHVLAVAREIGRFAQAVLDPGDEVAIVPNSPNPPPPPERPKPRSDDW